MDPEHIIVISDLHISAGPLDDFDVELESQLVEFLDYFSTRPFVVELVINGDFLDFVQAPPYSGANLQAETSLKIPLCFTQEQSSEKLSAVHSAHRATFQALQQFLASKNGNSITILPGNHDPDFFWETVRDEFREYVSSGGESGSRRINFVLQRTYRPTQCPDLWIEHGQQYDPINSFFISDYPYWSATNPPILSDGEQYRLYACLGTRFMIDYLNDLDATYPFVDNVKPFSRFVKLFLATAVSSRSGPLKAAVAGWGMLKYLSGLSLKHRQDLLAIDSLMESGKSTLLARLREIAKQNGELFQRLNEAYPGARDLGVLLTDPSEQEVILAWLARHMELFAESAPTVTTNQLSTDETDDSCLSLIKGFTVDETSLLTDGAATILDPTNKDGAKLAIMGHTHEPVAKPRGLQYYNTGSWTRYYRFSHQSDRPSAWSILNNHSYENFPYELNYVDIDVRSLDSAQMICFKNRNHD